MKIRISIVCIFLLISVNTAFAQTTAVLVKKKSPTRATIFSTVLPGLGQAYNHNYWKIPIIYAGFGGIGYGLYFYQNYYTEFRSIYNKYRNDHALTDAIPETIRGRDDYTLSDVREERNFARRWRDICIIGGSAWYLLNILDAYVYANLFDFDVSDDLSLHLAPTVMPTAYTRLTPGLSLSFSF
ncbi:MAG: DUF5683 domain-containing protein [Bacteroidales bacterium]|nr:DUF5683 domain-containing protein [Bacteroidales bacterium]